MLRYKQSHIPYSHEEPSASEDSLNNKNEVFSYIAANLYRLGNEVAISAFPFLK